MFVFYIISYNCFTYITCTRTDWNNNFNSFITQRIISDKWWTKYRENTKFSLKQKKWKENFNKNYFKIPNELLFNIEEYRKVKPPMINNFFIFFQKWFLTISGLSVIIYYMEEYLSECKSMISEYKDDIKQTLIAQISMILDEKFM